MRALNLSSLIFPISGVLSKTDMICYEGRCIRHIFLVGIPNHNLGVYPRNLLKAMRKMSF